MTIKEIRQKLNLSQKEFADMLKIPIGTIQHWEQECRKPPDYVVMLILDKIVSDPEIEETVKAELRY